MSNTDNDNRAWTMHYGQRTSWRASALVLFAGVALAAACSSSAAPVGSGNHQVSDRVFTNGGFETGAAGSAPPSWTIDTFINNGITVQTPQTLAGLDFAAGGKSLTTILASAGGPLSQPDPDLGATASLRWPRYGNQCTIVNFHSSTNFITGGTNNGKNVNTFSQTMTIGPGDVDATDGKVHVRFVVAPVLQNPAHPANEQPYYMVQLTDVTTNALLYSDFNLSGNPGVPWQKLNAGAANEIDFTDWQLVDITAQGTSLAMGDMVNLNLVASGCSPGGHFGELYVDGAATAALPGLFVFGSGPAQTNPCTNITYTLRYENGAATAAAGVVVTFNTPPSTTFVSINAPGLTCTTPAVGAAGAIVCTVGNVAAGGGGSFQVTVNVACGTTGTITAGNYSIQGTGIEALLGSHVNTLIGCTLDTDCPAGDWCDESKNLCTPTLANATPVPTDPPHVAPILNGTCTAAAGTLVCTSGVCDPASNTCGYLNGDGPCSVGNGDVVCDSAVCDVDGKCGFANGDGPCTVATGPVVCRSSVCDGADNKCGYANGDGPCTSATAGTVCRSGACSVNLTCEPSGGCNVDADCTAGNWCNESAHMCAPQIANGIAVPTDPPHTSPTLNGTCTPAAGALVCVSGVCDTKDNECGFANGDGPCTAATGAVVCRSSACSTDDTCEPQGGCEVDADCTAGNWCNETAHMCTPALANGQAIPTDSAHASPTLNGTCTSAAGALVCASGVCDTKDNECGYANGDGPCTAANGATDCRSTVCATSGPESGLCVACLMDSQCSGATPTCSPTTNTCVQCLTSATCPAATPVCDPTSSTCAACNGNSGTTATLPCPSGTAPFCFLSGANAGTCGKCATNADCADMASDICDTTSGLCTSTCATDADCMSTSEWCNAAPGARGMCAAKLANGVSLPTMPTTVATCSAAVGMRVCISGACDVATSQCGFAVGDGPCTTSSECIKGKCNPGNKTCELADAGVDAGKPDSGMDAGPGCHTDSQCSESDFCSASGKCTPKLELGATCDRAGECKNAECAGSVCSTVVSSGNGLCGVVAPGRSGSDGRGSGAVGLLLAVFGMGYRRRRRA